MSAPGLDEAMLRAQVEALKAENTRLTEAVREIEVQRNGYLADLNAKHDEAKALAETNTRHEEWRRDVERAALVLLKTWADYTSQETYGEHLRGLGVAFDDWDEAHGALRAALLADESDGATSDKPTFRQLGAEKKAP